MAHGALAQHLASLRTTPSGHGIRARSCHVDDPGLFDHALHVEANFDLLANGGLGITTTFTDVGGVHHHGRTDDHGKKESENGLEFHDADDDVVVDDDDRNWIIGFPLLKVLARIVDRNNGKVS
jgi:hypothetical protein